MTEIVRSPVGCTTEDPKPGAFVKWCSTNKVLWDKCTMGMSPTTGRCVIAQQLIKKDEVVIEVPDEAVLMGENCKIQEQLAEEGLLKPAEDALLEVQGLIIAVMYERALGKKSHWEPYLSFLPKGMTHMPIYWTEPELAELRGTAAYDKMVGRVQHPADAPTRTAQLFDELVLPFVQAHDSVRAVLLGKGHSSSTEEAARNKLWPQYQWATAAVASYSFVLGDDHYQGMVPVWDLLNHITGKVNVRLHHDAERGVLQMIATEDIPKGAEVVNCYGHLSNSELLRGYGYVEQHNTVQHVHVPAQFLIRAAAGAAAAAAGAAPAALERGTTNGTRQQHGTGAEASPAASDDADDDNADESSPDVSPEEGDDDMPGVSSAGEDDTQESDESSQGDDDDSSDDDEDDEPDWDLEDDSEDAQQQQQQQQPVPTLEKSMQLISDWEDRWQLCFSMKLLPKNNVFQVAAGGSQALPQQLPQVLLLLLADASDCEKLAAAAAAATSKAAAAATAAAAAAASKQGKSSKKQKKGSKQQKTPAAASAAAGGEAASPADSSTIVLEAVQRERALVEKLQFCEASMLHASLLLLVRLMQSRYSCSLAEDEQQLQQLAKLPPRLAAAVIARSSEKRVLQQLEKDLQKPSAPQLLMQQARLALQESLMQLATAAAAAALAPVVRADGCCHIPGCSHTHHQREDKHRSRKQDNQNEQHHHHQQQQQDLASVSAKGTKLKQQERQEEQQQGGSVKGSTGRKRTSGAGGHAAAAAAETAAGKPAGGSSTPASTATNKKHKRQRQQGQSGTGRSGDGDAAFAFNFQV